jgi:hypothetical protein
MRLRLQRLVFSSLTIAWLATTPRDALAFGGTARELERQGNFAVTNNADFNLTHDIGHGNGTQFSVRPALDYFVIDNLSIGGAIGLRFFSGSPDTTFIDLVPDIGYELALSDTWSIWPSASVPISVPNQGNATVSIRIFVPFLVHPAEHFFFGIGPGFQQYVTSPQPTQILGAFSIGGYFEH